MKINMTLILSNTLCLPQINGYSGVEKLLCKKIISKYLIQKIILIGLLYIKKIKMLHIIRH